jgi:hypothetical protein
MEMSSQKLAPETIPLNWTSLSGEPDTHNSGSNFQVNLILFLLLRCNHYSKIRLIQRLIGRLIAT